MVTQANSADQPSADQPARLSAIRRLDLIEQEGNGTSREIRCRFGRQAAADTRNNSNQFWEASMRTGSPDVLKPVSRTFPYSLRW